MFLITVLSGCAPTGFDRCRSSSIGNYAQVLSQHLRSEGIPHSLSKEGGVCFAKADSQKVDAVAGQMDNLIQEVATLMKDDCEERALIEWASKQSLSYAVNNTVDSNGKPSKRMFHLQSLTGEEVERNRRRLAEEAPRNVSCTAGISR